jgi:hypothetical protein
MMRMRSYLVSALSGACLSLLPACKQGGAEEASTAASYSEQGLGDEGRLSQSEWRMYLADQNYLHQLTRPDVRIRLNLADPTQHRFALARLKLAGKTPDNAPYLFKALEQRRQKHLAMGYKPGLLPQKDMNLQTTTGVHEMHYIEQANAGENSPVASVGKGVANSTFPGGAYYTYVDTSYSDASGAPLGSLTWTEQYDNGKNLVTVASGDLTRSRLRRYRVSSYKVEDSAAGFEDSFVYAEFGAVVPDGAPEPPKLATPVVEAPLDIKYGDNIISVCLDRAWTGDCDYDLTGAAQAIKLPLKGSIKVSSNHVINSAAIDKIRTDLKNGVVPPGSGQIKLVLTNVGGGCDVRDGNALYLGMKQFWDQVTVSGDKKTFFWDLTGANAAFFDDGCRQVQDLAKLTMLVPVPLLDKDGNGYNSSATLSNDPGVPRPEYAFKPIKITNSCLAEGTRIALNEQESAAIETLKAGDHVSNPFLSSLTITDTAVGVEKKPMVRIQDEARRTLLMTEMHPIQVVARGMVQARALREGDVVMTRTGPSKLTHVSREAYSGKVYNLKVGSAAEKPSLATDQTVVYANGFVVGDGQIQSKYEAIAMTQKQGDLLARLPSKWHRDYQLSTRTK